VTERFHSARPRPLARGYADWKMGEIYMYFWLLFGKKRFSWKRFYLNCNANENHL